MTETEELEAKTPDVIEAVEAELKGCLLYTSPSPRD